MRRQHHGSVISLALASCLLSGTGCYTLKTAPQPAPDVGSVVALDVTDQGRVALGGTIGPEIGQLEGRLLSRDEGEWTIAVSNVRFLRGGEQLWSGERVRITRDQMGNTYVRRFDRGRTIALSAAILAGVGVIIASRDLIGLGREGDPGEPPPTGGSLRFPVRVPLRLLVR